MNESVMAPLHAALDVLAEQLERAQTQTRLALALMANASKVAPVAATGLQPLMLLESDFSARLNALKLVREQLGEVFDEESLAHIRHRIAVLGTPGAITEVAPAHALN